MVPPRESHGDDMHDGPPIYPGAFNVSLGPPSSVAPHPLPQWPPTYPCGSSEESGSKTNVEDATYLYNSHPKPTVDETTVYATVHSNMPYPIEDSDDTREAKAPLSPPTQDPVLKRSNEHLEDDLMQKKVKDAASTATSRKFNQVLHSLGTQPVGSWNHLLPFLPYIEKRRKDTPTSTALLEVDKKAIDVRTLRRWLAMCDSVHGKFCQVDPDTASGPWLGPQWLMDTRDKCLVHASESMRYVALSYVWGGSVGDASASTTQANLAALSTKDGFLTIFNDDIRIPRTVLDAMQLVESLGERYLWVDRFCIVQDGGPAKKAHLNAMHAIYAKASFTIIAAQNKSANQGLYGQRPVKERLTQANNSQTLDHVKDGTTAAPRNDYRLMLRQARNLMRSTWYTRGWTLQEHFFSRRKLIFHDNTVNWECVCCAWPEGQDMSSNEAQVLPLINAAEVVGAGFASRQGLKDSPWPDMHRYARLISMLNMRDFTMPEDILDASAGILSHLSRTFPGGFISGMPTFCFDAVLLWQPWNAMARRKPTAKSEAEARLPSWSWAGWAGNFMSESWRSAATYMKQDFDTEDELCSWLTKNTVQWFHSETREGRRKEIRAVPQTAGPRFEYIASELEPGWTKSVDRATGKVSFHHTSDPSYHFRHPIPMRDPYKAHIPPMSSHYLHCHTRRAFLKLRTPYKTHASRCPALDLVIHERRVGVLRLGCFDPDVDSPSKKPTNFFTPRQLQKFKGSLFAPSSSTLSLLEMQWAFAEQMAGQHVELIELSAGEVQSQSIDKKPFDEWTRLDWKALGNSYKFYNVMWIERRDGVAFRKAIGRVEKSAWEGLKKEEVEITLG